MERKSMKRAITSLLFFLLCPASLPAQTQKPLLLGLASISGGIETLYVTKKIGAFKRNGLEVDFPAARQPGAQVLLSGEIKLISGGVALRPKERASKAPELIVATYTPTMPYSLYVNGKNTGRQKAQGAKIAISPFRQFIGFRRALC
jgi:ABC-type nitrate/sulfonate/bicarbonate transport system substrate-binding protein